MTAITITDLNNAKLDVDHIAAIATSTGGTATDRLGNVKMTVVGAVAEAVAQTGAYSSEAVGRAATTDGKTFRVQGSGDIASYEYRRTNGSTSVLIASYPAISAYNAAIANSFASASFTVNEISCVKCIENIELIRFNPYTGHIKLLQLSTNGSGKVSGLNFVTEGGEFLTLTKTSEDILNGFETWSYYLTNKCYISVVVNTKLTPISFTHTDSSFATNNMLVQQYVDEPLRQAKLYSSLFNQYIEFTSPGVYDASGNVTQAYGGYYKSISITKPGFYQVGWALVGTVRFIHAVNVSGAILASWHGDLFSEVRNKVIDVPEGTTELRLSEFSNSAFSLANPKNGFLVYSPKAAGATYGLISEDQVKSVIETYPPSDTYNKQANRAFLPATFTANEFSCIKGIESAKIIRFTGFTNPISLMKLVTDSNGKVTELNFFYYTTGNYFIVGSKINEDLVNGYETWAGSVNGAVEISVLVNVKLTPVSFNYVDTAFATNQMRFQQYVDQKEYLSDLYNELYNQYIEFTESGVYGADGNVALAYGGYHKSLAVTKTGFYKIGWTLGGAVRCMHAVNSSGVILATWNGDYFNEVYGMTIDVPVGTTELRLSSYRNSGYNFDHPKDGFLIHTPKASGSTYGDISETRVAELIDFSNMDDAPYIEILGNMWNDGNWRNSTDVNSIARVYPISSNETYELLYAPNGSLAVPEQTLSSLYISSQLGQNQSFAPITHNSLVFNNLGADCDIVTVNSYARNGYTAVAWTPPVGAHSLIVQTQYGAGNPVQGIRLFKRKGAKGIYTSSNNANKKIAVCGDSVAANPGGEIGKEKLRNRLGCTVDTFAVPGAGFSYNATPTWITANNVSGVMQVEELVKAGSPTYDIFLLSGTLNDPVTHNKAVGSITHCKPYLKSGALPDFTDPNLDTMLGAFNFCIQRIYEKNPKAKIVISTMGKMFLTSPTSGFNTAAGYDINSISTNTTGSTYYQYVQALRLLGESWGIPVVDMYSKAGINEFNKAVTMLDAYHPSDRGYEGMWNLWFDAVLAA